ncbi:MAG: DUF3299 domain-containing protein [Oligoflexales bacterium]|nr:DUF3299 domain-containing protein [Oligoflexales bacterium]
MNKQLFASSLILLSAVLSFFYPQRHFLMRESLETKEEKKGQLVSGGEPQTVDWRLLQKLNYKNRDRSKAVPPELKPVINNLVKVPGFAVPLSDDLRSIQDLLFVPNEMACIHVPAPPPNLILYIHLDHPMNIEDLIGPLWAQGILRLESISSLYGSSAYKLESARLSPYTF